jgi:hypothetical protein
MDPNLGRLVQAGAGAERTDNRRRRDATGFEIGGVAEAAMLALGRGRLATGLETVDAAAFWAASRVAM